MEQQPSLHGNQQSTLTSKANLSDDHFRRHQKTSVYARMLAAGRPLHASSQPVLKKHTSYASPNETSYTVQRKLHYASNPTQPLPHSDSQCISIDIVSYEQHGQPITNHDNVMPALAYNLQGNELRCQQQQQVTCTTRAAAAKYTGVGGEAASTHAPDLQERLQAWRIERARSLGMGPESFMPKVAVMDVVTAQPTNYLALQDAAKHWRTCRLQTYGHEILQLIRDWVHQRDVAYSCKHTYSLQQPTNSSSSDATFVKRYGSLDAAAWQPPVGLTVKCVQTAMQSTHVIDSPNVTHQSTTLCNGVEKATAVGQAHSHETLTSSQPISPDHRVGCTMSEAESRFDVDAFFGDGQLLTKQHSAEHLQTHSHDVPASSGASLQQHTSGMMCMPSTSAAKRRMWFGHYQLHKKFSSRQAARQLGLIKGSGKSAAQSTAQSDTGETLPELVPGAHVTVSASASQLHFTSPYWQCEEYGSQLDINAFFARPSSPDHSNSTAGIAPQVDTCASEGVNAIGRHGRQQVSKPDRRSLRLDAVVQHLRLTNPALLTFGSVAHGKLRVMVTGRSTHPWGLERSEVRMLLSLFSRQPGKPSQNMDTSRPHCIASTAASPLQTTMHTGSNDKPSCITESLQQEFNAHARNPDGAIPNKQEHSEQEQCSPSSVYLPPIPLSLEPGKRSVRCDIPDHPLLRERHKYELKEDAWILRQAIHCVDLERVALCLRRSSTAVKRRFKNLVPAALHAASSKKHVMQEELRKSLLQALNNIPNLAPSSSSRKNGLHAKASGTRNVGQKPGRTSSVGTHKQAIDGAVEHISSDAARKRKRNIQGLLSSKGCDKRQRATVQDPVPDKPRTGLQFATAVAPEDFSICSIRQLRTFLCEAGLPEPLPGQFGDRGADCSTQDTRSVGVEHTQLSLQPGTEHSANIAAGAHATHKSSPAGQPLMQATSCGIAVMQTSDMDSNGQLVRSMSSSMYSKTTVIPQLTSTKDCEDASLHARLVAAATTALPRWEVRRVLACKQLPSPLCHAAVLQYSARVHESMPTVESDRVLTAAYKRLSLLLHPDKHMSMSAGRMHLDSVQNYQVEQAARLEGGNMLPSMMASNSTGPEASKCCCPMIDHVLKFSSDFVREASVAFHVLQDAREQLLQGKVQPATVG